MATVLIAWELGAGLGHLVQLAPLARALAARGHRVAVALRDLSRAEGVFGRGSVAFLQAPFRMRPAERPIKPPLTFGHILHNLGWGDEAELRTMTAAWQNLYAMLRPDLIVFDHAPTALLAARRLGDGVKRVTIGSGFCMPPDSPGEPMPNLRPWVKGPGAEPGRLAADEGRLLGRVNRLLAGWGRPALERVTQLYSEVDEALLATFPELDHYPGRPVGPAQYWGPVYGVGGHGPGAEWPAGNGGGRKVFAYLKNFPALPALLEALERGGHPTVVVCDGVPPAVRQRFRASPTIRFEAKPLDLSAAGRECDLAVLNAGHGATAAMLLAGKPALLVPIHLEQGLLARAALRNTGACVEASYKDGADVAAKLEALLASGEHAEAARRFAATYADFDPAEQVRRMVERVEELLNDAAGRAGPSPARERARVPAGVFRA